MDERIREDARIVAELNDLLQLDHDAIQAYTIAIERLHSDEHRETLRRFRGDHERHVEDLSRLIRSYGGVPTQIPHLPTGAFKLAVQAVGAAGGDREILLAFKSNEGQVRQKYRRHAEREHPADVAALLERNADDEEKHYRWAAETLDRMGVSSTSSLGQAQALFERVHGSTADAVEGVERSVMERAETMRRSMGSPQEMWADLEEEVRKAPVRTLLAAAGAAFLLRRILR